jgi:hypothetical protein
MIGKMESREGLGIFLFTWALPSLLSMGAGALSPGVKRPGHEADHSPPCSAEVKECVELYLNFPNTPSWRGAQLKHTDNFTFNFTLSE